MHSAADSMTPGQRTTRARAAAYASWGNTVDPSARTKPARDAFLRRFEAEVAAEHPDLPEAEIRRMAEARRKAYFQQLALKSARARRRT